MRNKRSSKAVSEKKSKPLKAVKENSNNRFSEIYRKNIKPKTEGQQRFLDTVRNNWLTIGLGPAGTGKTLLAVSYAIERLLTGQCEKIILSRPIVPGGNEQLGALPGSVFEKVEPYALSMLSQISQIISQSDLTSFLNSKFIEVIPLAHIRGLNFIDSVVICDEMQNANFEQIKMLLTRLGNNCKMILTGDCDQSDLQKRFRGALSAVYDNLNDEKDIGLITMSESDIVRHELVGRILKRLKNIEL